MFGWICVLVIHLYFWTESGENVHANDDAIEERFDNIVVPEQDSRLYRGLKLKNGMKVLLISDSETQISAASLTVGIGALEDPPELLGLVNLVGHALMLSGKNQYRKFENFITTNGGRIEAPLTDEEFQCFSFEIASPKFGTALNKFAKYFVEPRIYRDSKSSTLLEALEMIENNYLNEKEDDTERITHVERSISKPNHQYNHLGQGNMSTLLPQARVSSNGVVFDLPQNEVKLLYTSVRLFHSLWYSSNLMTLAVLGKENLDKLEGMVTSLFHEVKRSDHSIEKVSHAFEDHPWGEGQLKNLIYVVPLDSDLQYLALSFPIRNYNEIPDLYNAAADVYVEYCITHEGRGTLFSVLKSRGLCTNVSFKYHVIGGIALARILCEVTDDGLEQTNTVINLIFQYIHLLNEDGPREWIFNEIRTSVEKAYIYSPTDANSLELARLLATQLQEKNFPVETMLSTGFTRNQWRPEIIKEFLSHLRPDNMNVTIVSGWFSQIIPDLSKEKYLGASHKIVKISEECLKEWNTKDESITDLQLPLRNEFISENLFMYPLDKQAGESQLPYIIRESSIFEIWFKQEERFRLPELHINFELISSVTRIGPVENTLWRVFYNQLIPSLNDHLYSPRVAGVQWADWSAEIVEPGLFFRLSGLGDKLPLMLEKILSKLTTLENDLDEDSFNSFIKRFAREVKTQATENYVYQGTHYLQNLYVDGNWNVDNTVNIAQMLQVSDMKKFLRKMFKRIFIRAFIYGNCNEKRALEIVDIFERSFPSSKGLLLGETLKPRIMEALDGSHYVYQVLNRNDGAYYSYATFFQVDVDSSEVNYIKTLLLYFIIKKTCNSFLMPADNEDENRDVQCSFSESYSSQIGFVIMVRSRRVPRYVHGKVAKYWQRVPGVLRSLTDDQFKSLKDELERFFTPFDISSFCNEYWSEISNRLYNFERSKTNANHVRSVTLMDLIDFVETTLQPSSPKLRILAVHVFPENLKLTNKAGLTRYTPPGAIKIEDISVFKSGSTWLPYKFSPRPHTHLAVNSDQEQASLNYFIYSV